MKGTNTLFSAGFSAFTEKKPPHREDTAADGMKPNVPITFSLRR
jgi:hypothetical protein